ncbi:hypothetical protein WS83_06095 [Burkholderia sp. MSMB2042]|nr:hypothetical protein WS78_14330 [Burkholderia savannae]KVG41686.1 hypothetical protein WS77_16590 [Burkholderia sp. MSMB0265]KVG88542.1 hypothetical protein WS81_24035 [Burkholderia sp. MSMB2040]KVG94757.1 hypothetical protein WS83_06095 [Burkholderia sp. MSMB2042]KVG98340.1 hypothetical protein WS82_26955 [Burkholderia sp. MSMB2041]
MPPCRRAAVQAIEHERRALNRLAEVGPRSDHRVAIARRTAPRAANRTTTPLREARGEKPASNPVFMARLVSRRFSFSPHAAVEAPTEHTGVPLARAAAAPTLHRRRGATAAGIGSRPPNKNPAFRRTRGFFIHAATHPSPLTHRATGEPTAFARRAARATA